MVGGRPIWEVVKHVERRDNTISVSINVNNKMFEVISRICSQSKDGLYTPVDTKLNTALTPILHTQGVKVLNPDKIGIVVDGIQNTRDLYLTIRIIYDLKHDEEINKTVFDQLL